MRRTWSLLSLISTASLSIFSPVLGRTLGVSGNTLARRNITLGSNPVTFTGAAARNSTTNGVHSTKTNDDVTPFECQVKVEQAQAELTFSPNFPNQLHFVSWQGAGLATCTTAMSSISFTIWAMDSFGEKSVIATGKPCVECAELTATSTNFYCQQAEFGGKCAGQWNVTYEAIIEAPVGEEFTASSGSCVNEGTVLTCSATAVAGTARPFENAHLPNGYVDNIELDPRAILLIRDTHFPGGKAADKSKGLFFPNTTDADLQTVFEEGLLDTSKWTRNSKTQNFNRVFPYSGIGVSSSGKPSTQMMLVITPSGGTVNTMYPM